MSKKGHIYFLFRKGVLKYIGQSTNVIHRLRVHFAYTYHDKVRVIECDVDKLRHYEKRLIKLFKPEVNLAHNTLYSKRREDATSRIKKNRKNRITDFPQLVLIKNQIKKTKF